MLIFDDDLTPMMGVNLGDSLCERYVEAAVPAQALRKVGAAPTRAGHAAALQGPYVDLSRMQVAFSATDHQGSKAVCLTQLSSGKAVPQTRMQ